MKGRRVHFWPGFPGGVEGPAHPGDYCHVPPGIDFRGNIWYCVDPTGRAGAIVDHSVEIAGALQISMPTTRHYK